MDGALEAAIDAYEQALELQPDLQAAEHNKALIERLLEQKNAEPPAPEKPPEPAAESPEPETPVSSSSPGTSGASAQHQENSSTATPSSEANPDESLNAEPDPDTGTDAEAGDGPTTRPLAPASSQLDEEHRQALEQWLKQIPDNPGELLRRKFWYEQQQHQDTPQ